MAVRADQGSQSVGQSALLSEEQRLDPVALSNWASSTRRILVCSQSSCPHRKALDHMENVVASAKAVSMGLARTEAEPEE